MTTMTTMSETQTVGEQPIHAAGKLHVGPPNVDDGIQAHGLHSDDFIIADVYTDMQLGLRHARENARRLCAAWNACDGVDTGTLEILDVKRLIERHEAHEAEVTEYRAALQDVIGWIPSGNWHTDAPKAAVTRARALLEARK